MKNKANFVSVLCILAIITILTSPKVAVLGATNGLMLWFNNIVPTLFPFLIIITLLNLVGGFFVFEKIFKHLSMLLHIPTFHTSIIVTGFLCGYPMGALLATNYYKDNKLSAKECEFLCLCSNFISPMFLSGYVLSMQSNFLQKIVLAISIYLPIIILFPIHKKLFNVKRTNALYNQTSTNYKVPIKEDIISLVDSSIMTSCSTILKIGGYIILCSILSEYILYMPFKSNIIKAILLCIIEITRGIKYTFSLSSINIVTKNTILASAICFSGICIILQSISFFKRYNIPCYRYITSKICQAILAGGIYILINSLINA